MFQTRQKLFRLIGFSALLLCMAPFCFAQVNAAPQLGFGTGARSLGLGGAFTAVADDATSTIWNPAGLPLVKDFTVTVSTAKLSFDRKHNFIGLVKKLSDTSGIGLAIINVGVDGLTRYDDTGAEPLGEFDFNSNAFSVSYGVAAGNLNFGSSIRLLTDSFGLDGIDASSKTGFGGIDLGALAHAYSNTLSYGVAIRNIGGSIAGSNLPVLLNVGTAFKVLRENVATFSADVQHEFIDLGESTTSVRIGAEYLIANTFAIRGGARATRDRRSLFAGFGIDVGGLQLDYALKPSDGTTYKLDNDTTHFVSLSYSY